MPAEHYSHHAYPETHSHTHETVHEMIPCVNSSPRAGRSRFSRCKRQHSLKQGARQYRLVEIQAATLRETLCGSRGD